MRMGTRRLGVLAGALALAIAAPAMAQDQGQPESDVHERNHGPRGHDPEKRIEHLRAIPRAGIALAVALTAAGYLSLTGYDALAFRWIRHPLGYPRIALASFIAYVFSHNVGLSFFGGSAVRYRMFTTWGVRPGELARVISFNVITFWLGFLALGGGVLSAAPLPVPPRSPLQPVGW